MALFKLEKSGRTEQDILEQPELFSVLLKIYELQKKDKSYATELCRELFDCTDIPDITKSIEYQRILRYLSKLQDNELIYIDKTKKTQGKKSIYKVNWNGIIKTTLDFIRTAPTYQEYFTGMRDKDINRFIGNKYIIAFLKMYLRGLAISPYFKYVQPISFKDAILLLVNRVMTRYSTSFEFSDDDPFQEEIDKYKTSDTKRSIFFVFLKYLCIFEQDYSPNSAIQSYFGYLFNFIKYKKENVKKLSKNDQDWYGNLLDIENHLDNIDDFYYPD